MISTVPYYYKFGMKAISAYYGALQRGCDIDKPRNLAKSVTVE